jgi:hypothetical protein
MIVDLLGWVTDRCALSGNSDQMQIALGPGSLILGLGISHTRVLLPSSLWFPPRTLPGKNEDWQRYPTPIRLQCRELRMKLLREGPIRQGLFFVFSANPITQRVLASIWAKSEQA